MKSRTSLFLFFLLLIGFSCKEKNCESIQTGKVTLSEDPSLLIPYADGEKLVLVNASGAEKVFENEWIEESFQICVKDLCVPLDPYKSKSCEYYTAEGRRNILRSADGNLLLELVLSVENYESESTLFYDFFSLHLSAIGTLAKGEYIPHVHFTDPVFNPDQSILKTPLIAKEAFELGGKTYPQVWHTAMATNEVYFSPGEGIIGIKLENEWWLLP